MPLATSVHWPPSTSACAHTTHNALLLLKYAAQSRKCHQNSNVWIQPPKNACHCNVPWWIKKQISDWSSTAWVIPTLKIWWRLVLADFEIICLTEIVKNKSEIKKKQQQNTSPPAAGGLTKLWTQQLPCKSLPSVCRLLTITLVNKNIPIYHRDLLTTASHRLDETCTQKFTHSHIYNKSGFSYVCTLTT